MKAYHVIFNHNNNPVLFICGAMTHDELLKEIDTSPYKCDEILSIQIMGIY